MSELMVYRLTSMSVSRWGQIINSQAFKRIRQQEGIAVDLEIRFSPVLVDVVISLGVCLEDLSDAGEI
jgi:hypothetical protein